MNVVAGKLELQSILLEQDVFYNGEIISTDMKKIILSTALDLLNISKDNANSKQKNPIAQYILGDGILRFTEEIPPIHLNRFLH